MAVGVGGFDFQSAFILHPFLACSPNFSSSYLVFLMHSNSVDFIFSCLNGFPLYMLTSLQYGLVHISAGDLLRAEISAGTENGKRAKEYMEKGQLVPDEVVVMVHLKSCTSGSCFCSYIIVTVVKGCEMNEMHI